MEIINEMGLSVNYYLILFFVLLLYLLILKRYLYSLIDPLLLLVVSESIITAAMIWMFMADQLVLKWLIYFLCSQMSFLLGLRVFKPIKEAKIIERNVHYRELFKGQLVIMVLIVAGFLYIILEVISYKLFGFGLYVYSKGITRNGTWMQGNGIGLISRLIQGTRTIILVSIFELYFQKHLQKNVILKGVVIILSLIILFELVMSGSKSSVLVVLYVLSLYRYFTNGIKQKIKLKMKFFLFIIACLYFSLSIIITKTKYQTTYKSAIFILGRRIVAESDGVVYTFSKKYDDISYLNYENPIMTLLSPFLTPLRIIPRSYVDPAIGIQISGRKDMGPNGRQSIVGFLAFSWGGIIFAFILGLIVNYSRIKLYYKLKNNFTGALLYIIFVYNFINLSKDPIMAMGMLFNDLLVFFSIYGFALFIVNSNKISNTKSFGGN